MLVKREKKKFPNIKDNFFKIEEQKKNPLYKLLHPQIELIKKNSIFTVSGNIFKRFKNRS